MMAVQTVQSWDSTRIVTNIRKNYLGAEQNVSMEAIKIQWYCPKTGKSKGTAAAACFMFIT